MVRLFHPRNPRFPAWAYIAEWQDNPAGPSWRGRCLRCPVDLPIRQVAARRIDLDVIAGACAEPEPTGPIPEAMAAAERDLIRHLAHTHSILVNPRPRAQLRVRFGRPPE